MKPENFPGVDVVLGAPKDWDADKNGPCQGLPISRRDGVCTSRWSLTFRERLAVLFGKRICVRVASFATQPPISLNIESDAEDLP